MECEALKRRSRIRKTIQTIFWIMVPVVIFGGLKYPLLGFAVPLVMLTGMIGGIFKGRFVCGWLCPRGAFFDRIMSHVSPKRTIPNWLRDYRFRWMIFALLMGFTFVQLSQDPGNIYHWGTVFVRMCIVTTAIGVILALIFHPRTWCSFCPIGTVQSATSGNRMPLRMEEGCKECRICEKNCPIGLKIIDNMKDGILQSRDCLRCHECQRVCPVGILQL